MMIQERVQSDAEGMQAIVDRLAARLGQPVLVVDRAHDPVWWSAEGAVDRARVQSMLDRPVDPEAARVVERFRQTPVTAPVHISAVAEADFSARWCMPVHFEGEFCGLVWVMDPNATIPPNELAPLVDCAERASSVMAHAQRSKPDLQAT